MYMKWAIKRTKHTHYWNTTFQAVSQRLKIDLTVLMKSQYPSKSPSPSFPPRYILIINLSPLHLHSFYLSLTDIHCCGSETFNPSDHAEICCHDRLWSTTGGRTVCTGSRAHRPDQAVCGVHVYNKLTEICCSGFV